jgi:hypothetical protein
MRCGTRLPENVRFDRRWGSEYVVKSMYVVDSTVRFEVGIIYICGNFDICDAVFFPVSS